MIKMTVDTSEFRKLIALAEKEIDSVADDAFKHFLKVTPIKTGNARRSTTQNQRTIEADYPYAEVLDMGRHMTAKGMRGSVQAPRGMTQPTVDYVVRVLIPQAIRRTNNGN